MQPHHRRNHNPPKGNGRREHLQERTVLSHANWATRAGCCHAFPLRPRRCPRTSGSHLQGPACLPGKSPSWRINFIKLLCAHICCEDLHINRGSLHLPPSSHNPVFLLCHPCSRRRRARATSSSVDSQSTSTDAVLNRQSSTDSRTRALATGACYGKGSARSTVRGCT